MASFEASKSSLEEIVEVEGVATLLVGDKVCWVCDVPISWSTACGAIEAAADGLEEGTVTVATQTVTRA